MYTQKRHHILSIDNTQTFSYHLEMTEYETHLLVQRDLDQHNICHQDTADNLWILKP